MLHMYICMFVFQYGRMTVAEYCNYKSNQIKVLVIGA